MPTITVITPVFNRVAFLEACVETVRNSQTFGEFELEHIIVDDGSTDGSVELVETLAKKYPHIVPVVLGKNIGPSGARNVAIGRASGEWIYFFDSDDLLFMHSLSTLFRAAKNGVSDWVYSGFVHGNTEGSYLVGQDYWGIQHASVQDVLFGMYTGKHFFQHSFLVKKLLVLSVDGYNEKIRLGEDFDICTRWLLAGALPTYVPGILHMRRIHDENLSKEFFADTDKHRRNTRYLYTTHEEKLKKILSDTQIIDVQTYLGL